jgi:hypothetical protein
MSKYFLVLAAFFLFGTQLTADSIQNLEITSLTVSQVYPLNGEISISASGPSFTISGSGGDLSPQPPLYVIGSSIGTFGVYASPGLPVLSPFSGLLNGITVMIQGAPVVSGTTNSPVPENGTVTMPATVNGEYLAFSCGSSQFPPNCTGPQIANIFVDLDGYMTLTFSAGPFLPFNETVLTSLEFTNNSIVPEPSSVLLMSFGVAAGLSLAMLRPGFPACQ